MLYRLVTSLTRTQKQWLFMLMDAGVIAIAMISAIALNAAVNPDLPGPGQLIPMILALVVTGSALSWWFGLPRFTLNAYDTRGIVRTAGFALVCGGFGGLFNGMIVPPLSLAVYFNFSLLLLVLAASWRILLRYATIEV